ncbi:tetratricopeptide repeat protein [Larkinella rosea]|uniref:Tetratricopeptide repeat protein n=1 Tax=Larkinella rosea TaxID=2025312 RepID=A0A3P1C1B4_9BACT|nr:tetratricopeptide repeat protein [Larkinella rosea]RRB07009.1 hypothetical protein EHT25_04285 [Larkinella rosea]
MNELDVIDRYFAGQLSPMERKRFEASLNNIDRVRPIAFYLLARQVARQEANRRKKPLPVYRPIFPIISMAASLLFFLGFGWAIWIWQTPVSAAELADQYLTDHFHQFPVTLDGTSDSLKTACRYYNQGNWQAAEAVFESLLQRHPNQPDALKFGGIVSLQLRKYDQAIHRFHRLGQQTDLYANPGIFLEAIAHLKRGQPMDKNRAKHLLHTVIQGNLEEKNEAGQLVGRLGDH